MKHHLVGASNSRNRLRSPVNAPVTRPQKMTLIHLTLHRLNLCGGAGEEATQTAFKVIYGPHRE